MIPDLLGYKRKTQLILGLRAQVSDWLSELIVCICGFSFYILKKYYYIFEEHL